MRSLNRAPSGFYTFLCFTPLTETLSTRRLTITNDLALLFTFFTILNVSQIQPAELFSEYHHKWPNVNSAIGGYQFSADADLDQLPRNIATANDFPEKNGLQFILLLRQRFWCTQ